MTQDEHERLVRLEMIGNRNTTDIDSLRKDLHEGLDRLGKKVDGLGEKMGDLSTAVATKDASRQGERGALAKALGVIIAVATLASIVAGGLVWMWNGGGRP